MLLPEAMASVAAPGSDDSETEIALSNFVLAGLREILRARCEAYVKWWMGRAFNGAGYECDAGPAQVLFFKGQRKLPDDDGKGTRSYPFARGWVEIAAASQDGPAIQALLASSEAAFGALRASQPERLLAAARLQLWVIYRSSAAGAEQDLRALADQIVGRTGGTVALTSPFSFGADDSEWNGDIDVALPEPIPEPSLRARLGTFIGGLDDPLFGFGAACPNHDGQRCRERALLFAHITVRQF
jgi:hypothetical protein